MVDIEKLRPVQFKAGGVKIRLRAHGHNGQYLTHEESAAFEFSVNSAIQMPAALDELTSLRDAVIPKMMCDDQTLADAVRAAARSLNPHDINMELELAAQHIEAGRITTCSPFGYEIENDRLREENTALRAAQQWRPLCQDNAECILLDCLKAMKLPRDEKLLIDEMRKRNVWVYQNQENAGGNHD